jgi:dihydrodipicolinate synthase/N-acetylneuraminate lyase
MKRTPVTPADIARSVIAVPPLARNAQLDLDGDANRALLSHLRAGGVTSVLYGGNANLYHIGMRQYAQLVEELPTWTADDTWIIPSIGPSYGQLLEQAQLVRDAGYPTAMVLPLASPATPEGTLTGLRHAAAALAAPVILYIKWDGYLTAEQVASLVDDGVVCGIKYAVVRADPRVDPYLEALLDVVDARLVISGIGERPAIVHVRQFGLPSFTSGSVCVAPRQSTALLEALRAGREDDAERLRQHFLPLEDLRDALHPARVLHDAVTLAGVADMGPMLPLLSGVSEGDRATVEAAARALLRREGAFAPAA